MTAWAVYRVMKDGRHVYLDRSVTFSEKLAREIAAERSRGEITMPDGRIKHVKAFPHIAKPVEVTR